MFLSLRPRSSRALVLLATVLMLASATADARAGRGGFGMGSRGARTFEAPPATPTAPRQSAPIERSTTPAQSLQRSAAAPASGGFFSRRGGFMGGLLGAGLLGMFLGYGLFGGLGGLASILGLLLQVVLIVWLARLAIRAFQRRAQPAAAGAAPPLRRDWAAGPGAGAGNGASSGRTSGGRSAWERDSVGIGEADYQTFEHLLADIQAAYGREDLDALRADTTPEMAGYFERELAENRAKGVVNRLGDARLLQGDLAEAWREGGTDYATVAMRFSLIDTTVERASGRTVEGDPARPTEATEAWTFTRPKGGRWILSAIQPA